MNKELLSETFIFSLNSNDCLNLFDTIKLTTNWDESMKSRKTASYGKNYNYNQMDYPTTKFPLYFNQILHEIRQTTKYKPNNCLINYYYSNESSMGFHADETSNLVEHTGITILSLGTARTLRFKNILSQEINDIILEPCTFFHMSIALQKNWKHAILSEKNSSEKKERISLTFRKIR